MAEFDEQLVFEMGYNQGFKNGIKGSVPKSVLEDIKAEIQEWYWQTDKQYLAKDPCVVDAMVDLFIRTIDKHLKSEERND